ncbi:TBC1 domain family member 1-like isoform X2 [Lytechinus variegatus]|uniref:TBC1 domain family member 1-like isoform X2 n=1 Tax=Lytechinus variegatus TaxID=7654 RepID=UPI001BB153AB|nr:TBC1 domain family member 1-like isoform X2 [Lytechinus variegatus]
MSVSSDEVPKMDTIVETDYFLERMEKDYLDNNNHIRDSMVSQVNDVVTSIRESDKENIPQSAQAEGITEAMDILKESNSSMFEVLYCGKISVSHKRAPPTFIDESIEKFKEHEMMVQRRKRHFSSDDRQRSLSDASPKKSSSLDIVEEDISKSHSDIDLPSVIQNIQNNNSNDSTLTIELPRKSSLPLTDNQVSRLQEDSPRKNSVPLSGSQDVDSGATTGRTFGTLPRTDSFAKLMAAKESTHNRTMVFQIGRSTLTIISLDKKSFALTKKFSEISFCSQGIKQPEYFGFICREKSSSLNYMCYVFKCQSESVVECIMNTLRQAFNAALHHNKLHIICETCPMHKLHKFCQEVEGLNEELVWTRLQQQISALGVSSSNTFALQMRNCQVSSQQEQNHLAMMFLMKVCEQQQQNHTHISDEIKQKEVYKSDSNRPTTSKLESLKKAKKSLTSSFENLLTRNKHRSSPGPDRLVLQNGREESPTGSPCATPPPLPNLVSPLTSPSSTTSTTSTASSTTSGENTDIPEGRRPPPHPSHHQQPHPHNPNHPHHPTKQQSADAGQSSVITPLPMRQRSRTLGDTPLTPTTPTSPRATFQFEGDQFKALRAPKQKPPLIRAMSVGGRAHLLSPPGHSPRTPLMTSSTRTSWRQAIFNRVVTPMSESKAPPRFPDQSESVFEEEEEDNEEKKESKSSPVVKRFTSRLAVRALWQRAIREQIILNRMDKENKRIQARQDAVIEKKMKLDYEEITPCLVQVTKQWDRLIAIPNRANTIIPYDEINTLFKEGVPRTRRGDIWMMLSEQHLLRMVPGASQIPESEPYTELLKQLTTHQHAILIDLGRTYPNHPYFSNALGRGQLSLFNLLKAYSLLDAEVGYCQGLSFVAGILLMHMEEHDAFKMLTYLMFGWGFRRQYKPDMTALQIQMYQLSRLLHDFYHRLHNHLEQNEVAPSLYAAPWFLTLFASQFPLGFVSKVFDLIFLQGFEVIFKVALVILGSHEELILQCDGFESIIDFIKNQLPSLGIVQMEKVINKAYHLDISKELHAYEVEYHVIQEEMLPSPVQPKSMQRDIDQLEFSNRNLRRHNNELLEQLQSTHNTIQNQRSLLQTKQTTENNLRLEIRNLNLERAALLDTIAKLQALIPENILSNASLDLIQPKRDYKCYDSESSHQTIESAAGGGDNLSIDTDSIEDIDGEVAAINKVLALKEERSRNNSGGSIGSGQSASTNTSEADIPCIMITDTKSISSL